MKPRKDRTYRISQNKRTGGFIMALPRDIFTSMHEAGISFSFEVRPDERIIVMHPHVEGEDEVMDTEAADALVRNVTGGDTDGDG